MPPQLLTRPWIVPAAAAVLLALMLLTAPGARAAGPGAGGYTAHAWAGCAGGTNGGSWDDAGRVYVPCGSTIGIYDDATGRLVQRVAAGRSVTEVAPTRDGAFIYVAGPGAAVSRLARTGGAGSGYAPDATWRPQQYVIWGSSRYAPLGRYLAVDRAGHVYVAHGMWVQGSPHTVIKYRPDGTVVTRFGEYRNGGDGWQVGEFYWSLAGIAVSDDGSVVYTAEVGNDRVQTWERQGDGRYVSNPTRIFGDNAANSPNRDGGNDCDYVGLHPTLAAVYDVSLDRAGNLYVLNTTCKQVLKFSPGFGRLLANLDVRVAGTDIRPHGMAVAADGSVWVGENQRVWRAPGRGAPDPAPGQLPSPSAPSAPSASSGDAGEQGAANADIEVTPRPTRPPIADAAWTDTTAPRVSKLRVTRARGVVRTVSRCNERCRVELRVIQRGRTVSRRVVWLPRNRRVRLDARLGRSARRGRRAIVQLRIRDRAGNTRTLRRAVTLR